LHTYLPVTVIVLTFLYDITLALGFPRPIRNALEWLSAPFRNFLTLEDLDEAKAATKNRILQPQWKHSIFVALPLLQAVLDVSLSAFHASQDKHAGAMRHLLLAISWVNEVHIC
jgi:hypothetical protein